MKTAPGVLLSLIEQGIYELGFIEGDIREAGGQPHVSRMCLPGFREIGDELPEDRLLEQRLGSELNSSSNSGRRSV